jgi:hypothetical protein
MPKVVLQPWAGHGTLFRTTVFAADVALGRYLQASIKTGTFCSFMPI